MIRRTSFAPTEAPVVAPDVMAPARDSLAQRLGVAMRVLAIGAGMACGATRSAAAREVARATGLARRDLY